jgi:hypothetical protein
MSTMNEQFDELRRAARAFTVDLVDYVDDHVGQMILLAIGFAVMFGLILLNGGG